MNQPRILVVEDESIVSLEIQSRLEELGYAVAGAVYSGEDAISTSKEVGPDLILMDINLRGDIDGIQAANTIRSNQNIPVIYMTAYADDETIQRAKVSEPYAYIIKPIEVRELHTSIEIALFKSEMEKKLVESEKRFRGLFENATLGLYRTTLNGEIILANPALIKMLGFENLKELKERNLSTSGYVDEKRREEFVDTLQENYNVVGFESEWRRKDGSTIYISESARKEVDPEGNIFYEGTVEDITDRKVAELELKKSEEILGTVFDSVYNGIIIHDLDGNIIKVNKRVEDFHGVPEKEILKLKIFDLIQDESVFEEIKKHWDFVLSGKTHVGEYKLPKLSSDLLFDIEIHISKIVIDNKDYILANFRNITEQKRAKEAIVKAKETLQQIYDNVYNAIFIHDITGRIIDLNEKALKMFGVDRLTALTLNITDISAPENDFTNVGKMWESVQSGENQLFEWKAARPNSNYVFDVEVFLTKININNNDYILANVRDITEQKEAQKALLLAKESAEKSDRLKSEFLAGMSHEIRTPVNTILSYSSLLKEELKEEGFNHFEDIFHSISFGGKRLIRTVDSILNMSQIQTGTFDLDIEQVDLDESILIPLFTEFKVEANNKGLDFFIEKMPNPPKIKGDSYSLGQLFTNLIDNALKYTNDGHVKIKTYRNESNFYCVDISDSGIGISEEFIGDLFNPFTQETQGYTRRFDGNGLGLALVKKYCDMNNAAISVKSKKGEGSTFTVCFNY